MKHKPIISYTITAKAYTGNYLFVNSWYKQASSDEEKIERDLKEMGTKFPDAQTALKKFK